jgi:signal transduction histidine kinase/ActR/RegA family two-component response regulator
MAVTRSVQAGRARALESNAPQLPRRDSQQPATAEIPSGQGRPTPQAGVTVDRQLRIIEFLGNTGPYLQLPVGTARLNLRLMLRPGLQHPVLEAVQQVREGAPASRRERLALKHEAGVSRVNVEVNRLDRHPSGKPVIRVLFQEAAPPRAARPDAAWNGTKESSAAVEKEAKDIRVERLKQDLLVTRATLESIIEEQEIGTARLKMAYYQLESANAELEATNEELATVNSELEAVNEQLAAAVRERDEAERERERMETEVIQAQRLESLRVMAGGVAHDFNNLLTSIVGNAGVLLEELPRDAELWDAAEQIEKAGQHAAGLVKQMLAFCGKGAFATEPLDLSALVSESVDLLRASISKTAELRCELAEDLPAIEADATQVRQVLINLVVNASEAIGNVAGVIRVSSRRLDVPSDKSYRTSWNEPLGPGAYVCLEVADTGHGMSGATKAKIFEPFFSTKFAGRGLGLAAVQGIVRGHHGSIQVRSRHTQGTEMQILFPAARHTSAPPAQPAAAANGWLGGGAVLVVDDEESVRNVAKAILKRAGLRVLTAAGGREALDLLRRNSHNGGKVGAVLLDLVMPRMDGKEVLKELRSFSPDLPVILSSGYTEEHENGARLAAHGQPTRFLPKPYRPAELLERVREALAAHPAASGAAASGER